MSAQHAGGAEQGPARGIERGGALAIAAVTALSLLLALAGADGWPRQFAAIAALTLAPGAAILSFLPRLRPLERAALVCVLSLATVVLVCYVLLLLHIFYPAIVVWGLLPLSIAILLWRAPRARPDREPLRRRGAAALRELADDRVALVMLGVLVVAVALWYIGATAVDYHQIGGWGLVPLLPATWKTGMALIIGAIAGYATTRAPRPWLMVTAVAVLILAIFLTPVIVYDVPHYPWTYKHIGVTEFLLEQHRAVTRIDIYNRWPSFFAAAGVYRVFGGFSNAIGFAGWAEAYFVLLQALLVAALARTEERRVGLAGFAATAFVLINWIGQAYFSPQAMGFTLMLGVLLVVFAQLYARGNRLGGLLARIGGWIARREQSWHGPAAEGAWSQRTAAIALLAIDAAVVLVHQMTPYVLLFQLILLTLFGFMRPRWLVVAVGLMTFAYLVPNLGWINQHFRILNSLNPLANASRGLEIPMACNAACRGVNLSIMASTAFAALAATAAIVFLGRRRPDARLGLLSLCFFAPFLTLLGQSYGGEAILRVVMFSAPFSAILIAMAIFELRRELLRTIVAGAVLLLLALGFLLSYFGLEENRYLTPQGVRAAEHLYRYGQPRSLVVALAPQVPGQLSSRYWMFDSPFEAVYVDPKLRHRRFWPGMPDELADWAAAESPSAYVTFAPELEHFNEIYGLMPRGTPEQLRRAMLTSPRWQLWYRDGDAEIFRLRQPAGGGG
jgi:hypothetical protein